MTPTSSTARLQLHETPHALCARMALPLGYVGACVDDKAGACAVGETVEGALVGGCEAREHRQEKMPLLAARPWTTCGSACHLFDEMPQSANVRRKKKGERNTATWMKTGQQGSESAAIPVQPRQGTKLVWF